MTANISAVVRFDGFSSWHEKCVFPLKRENQKTACQAVEELFSCCFISM